MISIRCYIGEAEGSLDQMVVENPELSQALMMRGIGYALLAVAHELRVIEQMMKEEVKK